jgi:hypothetical protein
VSPDDLSLADWLADFDEGFRQVHIAADPTAVVLQPDPNARVAAGRFLRLDHNPVGNR